MPLFKQRTIHFIAGYALLFYLWIILFQGNEQLLMWGTSLFSIIGGSVSCVWLVSAYREMSTKLRVFWFPIIVGVFCFFIAICITLDYQVIVGTERPYPSVADFLWLAANCLFLAALIYKVKLVSHSVSFVPFLYNIFIFMTVSITVSAHYLIKPLLQKSSGSMIITIITLAYPIINLGILFTAISLYYLAQYSEQKTRLLFIVVSFLLQIIADSVYVILTLHDKYAIGSLIDPLWTIVLLLIGQASLLSKDNFNYATKRKEPFRSSYIFFPYIMVLLLLLVVFFSSITELNILSIGISLTILLLIVRQITIMKMNMKLVNEYKYLAYRDPLTGLNNRTKFKEDLRDIIAGVKNKDENIALILIDLDRFKNINDTMGHYFGDLLLKAFSERLLSHVHNKELLYRIGGDEFIIILPGMTEKTCNLEAQKMLDELTKSLNIQCHEIVVTPSIGISIYPENGDNIDTLLKNADTAMYLAKDRGKNNFQFYNSELNAKATRKMNIEIALRRAILNEELSLFYQPKVDLFSRGIVGMEALIRWNHPEMGAISPIEFIPVAEETGQIISIGKWVLETACKQNKKWQEASEQPLTVSVNVSVRQFEHSKFVETVKDVLKETQLEPAYLELEITESVMQNFSESIEIIRQLRAIGVKISIDDFGTGYSSLSVLKRLPIDTIKIDKSFIDDIMEPMNQSIVKTIIDIGLNLNLNVVAEGIEHVHQIEVLTKNSCHFGQGYLFAKPVHPDEFKQLLMIKNEALR
ncbi:EAL domain-containing protein [Halalkalibacter urbisdiaboli]|uniref:EAL domain-containing protein n=1 Tax=Halalkalibacter urbisdiaboli TaxID=1960589 RepID=UPI001FDA16C2|nr:EAL domain-containing protein [Halalkalibacter urbisdiaboli]